MRYKRNYRDLPKTTKQVASEGPEGPLDIVVVSLSPSSADIAADRPMRGTRGGLMRQILSQVGFDPDLVWNMYVWDFDPDVSLKPKVIEQFWLELRWVITERKAKVVVGLGDEVQKVLGIEGSVNQTRGSVYELNLDWPGPVVDPNVEPCHAIMLMTHDPEWLISHRWTKGGRGTADNMVNSVHDFQKAISIASHGYVRYEENFEIYPTLEKFQAWGTRVLAEKPLLAVDIETDGFSGKPMIIGFATSGTDAFCVPILKKGGLEYWSPMQWPAVRELLNQIFEQVPQVYQNALFDVPRLHSFGLRAKFSMVRHDTMLLHHVVDPEAPHNLGYITSIYGATPFWKEGIFDQGLKITQLEDHVVRVYNLRDCIVLHQILPGLLADLADLGKETSKVYFDETLPLMSPVHAMQLHGIKLSESRRLKFADELAETLVELEEKIKHTFDLPLEFNLGSSDHLGIILYGEVPAKFLEAAEKLLAKKEGTKVHADLVSQVALASLPRLWGFNKSDFRVPTGAKSSKPSTDSGARLSLIVAANKRLDWLEQRDKLDAPEAKQIQKLIQFLDMFSEFQEIRKLSSTYTEFPTWADGRVHGSYLIHGTSTGRLASRKPNMQNFPKKSNLGKQIRKLFVAPRGRVFVSADYSNLEARIVGYEANEKNIQDIFARGLNQHDINTKNLFHLTPKDPKWDLARRAAKTFQFGSIQYGGSDREIHRKISIEVPELGLTLAELKIAKENYFKANPNLLQWRLKVEKEVTQTRKIQNAFGRVRLFRSNAKDIIKEAYNFPMQSAAASIINDAMIRIFRKLIGETTWSQDILIAQIHDQLVFEIPDRPEHVKEFCAMVKKEMERPRMAWGQKVSFPVDFEIGPSLGELTAYSV